MEEGQIGRGGDQAGIEGELVTCEGDADGGTGREDGCQLAIEHGESVGVEGDGAGCAQVLVHAEKACAPLPTAMAFRALEGDFLGDGVDELALLEGEDIGGGEVLVHEEAVGEMLEGGDGAEGDAGQTVFYAEAGVGQLAAIATGTVLGQEFAFGAWGEDVVGQGALPEIGAGVFVAVFIGGRPVDADDIGGAPGPSGAGSGGIGAVLLMGGGGIAEEAVGSFVVGAEAEAHLWGGVGIGGQGGASASGAGGPSGGEGCSVVGNGVGGEDADDASHGVASIEGALGATEDIDAFDAFEGEVVGGFVDVGDVVDVESYGGGVDAGTDTSDVAGGGEAATVCGDVDVGGVGGEGFEGVDLTVGDLLGVEEGYAEGLATELLGLFGGGYNYGFLDVEVFDAVGGGEKGG